LRAFRLSAVLTLLRLYRRPCAAKPSRTAEADVAEIAIARRFGLGAAALGRVVEEAASGP
jgi:hypothetical protein